MSSAPYKSYSPQRLCPQHLTSPTAPRDCVLRTLHVQPPPETVSAAPYKSYSPPEILSSAPYRSYSPQTLCPQHPTGPKASRDCVLSTLQVLQPQRLCTRHPTSPATPPLPQRLFSAPYKSYGPQNLSSAHYKSYSPQRWCPQHLTSLTAPKDCVLMTLHVQPPPETVSSAPYKSYSLPEILFSAPYRSYSPQRLCPQHPTGPTASRECVLSTL